MAVAMDDASSASDLKSTTKYEGKLNIHEE
jgi:hypothetical protein